MNDLTTPGDRYLAALAAITPKTQDTDVARSLAEIPDATNRRADGKISDQRINEETQGMHEGTES